MPDTERLRRALAEFHAAHARAEAATLGTDEFAAAMDTLRKLRDELAAGGVDPMTTWRESTQRALGHPARDH